MTEEQRQFLEQRLQTGYDLTTTDCLRDGFRLYRLYPWGFFSLALLLPLAANFLAIIPGLGLWVIPLSAWLFGPIFNMGFYIGGQRILEDGKVTFNELFQFQGRLPHLLLSQAMYMAILTAVILPTYFVLQRVGYIDWYADLIAHPPADPSDAPHPPEMNGLDSGLILSNLLPFIYLSVSFLLIYPVLYFFNTNSWEALEYSRRLVGKRWFTFFSLVLFFLSLAMLGSLVLGFLIAMGGIIAFIANLGLFTLVPWFHLSLYAAFTRAMNPVQD